MTLAPAEPSPSLRMSDTIHTPGRIVFATLTGVFACFWILILVTAILGRHQTSSKVPGISASVAAGVMAGLLLVYLLSLLGILLQRRWGWYLTVLLAMWWLIGGVAIGVMAPSGHAPRRFGVALAAFLVAVSSSYLVYFGRRAIRRAFAVELPWIDLWAWFSICAGLGGALVAMKYSFPTQIFWWLFSGRPGRAIFGFLGIVSLAAGIGVIRRMRWGWTLAVMVLVYSLVNGMIVTLFPHPEMAARFSAVFPHVAVTPEQLRGAWRWSLPWFACNIFVSILLLIHRAKFAGCEPARPEAR